MLCFRLPGQSSPVALWNRTRRLQLRAQLRIWLSFGAKSHRIPMWLISRPTNLNAGIIRLIHQVSIAGRLSSRIGALPRMTCMVLGLGLPRPCAAAVAHILVVQRRGSSAFDLSPFSFRPYFSRASLRRNQSAARPGIPNRSQVGLSKNGRTRIPRSQSLSNHSVASWWLTSRKSGDPPRSRNPA